MQSRACITHDLAQACQLVPSWRYKLCEASWFSRASLTSFDHIIHCEPVQSSEWVSKEDATNMHSEPYSIHARIGRTHLSYQCPPSSDSNNSHATQMATVCSTALIRSGYRRADLPARKHRSSTVKRHSKQCRLARRIAEHDERAVTRDLRGWKRSPIPALPRPAAPCTAGSKPPGDHTALCTALTRCAGCSTARLRNWASAA